MRRVLLAVSCSATLLAVGMSATAATPTKGPQFSAPVLLTTDKGAGGYEPGVVVDKFNNVFVTAHKQNHTLVVSPDARSTTKVRSQSWLWTSKDGKTFTDMPGLTPLQEQNAEFGDEGDLAYDETGHLYFVDTNVTDNSFSRYKASGNGKLALETTRPVGPFGEAVDDRPWIVAHGDGVVMYAGNNGDKATYPAGAKGDGAAYGPGRYTVYMSYNHGDTFDPLGITLADSGWCRPGADHRKGSKDLYMLCTNDGGANDVNENAGDPGFEKGTLWAYSSHDDGKTWARTQMGTYDAKNDTNSTYPSMSIGKDGTLYALYCRTYKGASHLLMYTSKDKGRSWSQKEVTPAPGKIRYTWLDVAPDGTVGIAYYYRPNASSDWFVYAATSKNGSKFVASKVSGAEIATKSNPSAFGDFFQIAFGPDSKLNVVWTVQNKDLVLEGLNTDIYYAKQK